MSKTSPTLRPADPTQSAQHVPRAWLWCLPLCLACASTLTAQEWRTADSFQRQLRSKTSVSFESTPIRDCLQRLAKANSVAVFLDRRVDPTTKITLQIEEMPLEQVLRGVAKKANQGLGFVGPLVYVGPPLTTSRLATLAALKNEQAAAMENEQLKKSLLTPKALSWDRLTEPRWIARKLCAEADLRFPEAALIPHDLWPECKLPPLTLAERLTLVLAGFGITYTVEETDMRIKLRGMPRAVAIERQYRTRVDVARILPVLAKDFPGAFIKGENRTLTVRSTVEDHRRIEAYLNPDKERDRKDGQQVFSLTVKNQPLNKLIEQIATRLGMTIEYSEGAATLAEQRVSFTVSNVSAEELFQAAVGPANLSATVEGTVVKVE